MPTDSTLIHQRVEAARTSNNPYVICRMQSGWAVLGDFQFFHGYSLLLPDPVVVDLNALSEIQRALFLADMTKIGDALLVCTDAYKINYEILGNTHQALHAHIFPRYTREADTYRKGPIWHYSKELRHSVKFDPKVHLHLMHRMRTYLLTK